MHYCQVAFGVCIADGNVSVFEIANGTESVLPCDMRPVSVLMIPEHAKLQPNIAVNVHN